MRLLGLSFKYATVKWWRSLTLGFFIFSVSFVMVISGSFITAARNKVDKVVTNGITGHIQIRSGQTMEGDMAVQYNPGWDALKPIDKETISAVTKIVNEKFSDVKLYPMVRRSAFLTQGDKREETMLLGIAPDFDSYKEAFLLKEGRYLDPEAEDEILLTEEQANSFKVKTGDTISITTKNIYGLNSSVDLKVVGIGNYIMLSLFSYKADYTSENTVTKLAGTSKGEVTDLLLYLQNGDKAKAYVNELAAELKAKGIKYTITANEKLKSEDLEIRDLELDSTDAGGVMLSSYEEMGVTFKGVSDTMFVLLNFLVAFLLIIVSILIVNLVYMTGLERFREIGTLRAIGFSRFQVIRIFMGEILSVSLISGLVGILSALAIVAVLGMSGVASPIPALDFMMGKTLNLEIDPGSIAVNMAVIIGFSFAASFFPAYKACSVDPAETLRTV